MRLWGIITMTSINAGDYGGHIQQLKMINQMTANNPKSSKTFLKIMKRAITMSIKPMRSTGITGQSSSRGTWVIPNIYLQLTRLVSKKGETCATMSRVEQLLGAQLQS